MTGDIRSLRGQSGRLAVRIVIRDEGVAVTLEQLAVQLDARQHQEVVVGGVVAGLQHAEVAEGGGERQRRPGGHGER